MMKTELRTFLWFSGELEEALNFYRETFGDLEIRAMNRIGEKLFTAEFSIFGHGFVGMNWEGGPEFNESISLSLDVDGQTEVDRLWDAITAAGSEGQCGWCKDKWGLSWQITPKQMHQWLQNSDPNIRKYANDALMKMGKIILDDLHE